MNNWSIWSFILIFCLVMCTSLPSRLWQVELVHCSPDNNIWEISWNRAQAAQLAEVFHYIIFWIMPKPFVNKMLCVKSGAKAYGRRKQSLREFPEERIMEKQLRKLLSWDKNEPIIGVCMLPATKVHDRDNCGRSSGPISWMIRGGREKKKHWCHHHKAKIII